MALLHVAAFSMGYFICKGLGFNEKTSRTVSIETGVHPCMALLSLRRAAEDRLLACTPSCFVAFQQALHASFRLLGRMGCPTRCKNVCHFLHEGTCTRHRLRLVVSAAQACRARRWASCWRRRTSPTLWCACPRQSLSCSWPWAALGWLCTGATNPLPERAVPGSASNACVMGAASLTPQTATHTPQAGVARVQVCAETVPWHT